MTPRRGEKLAAVAKRNHISLPHLKQLNGIGPRVRVSNGNTLLLPAGAMAARHAPERDDSDAPTRVGKSGKHGKHVSTVKPRAGKKSVGKAKPHSAGRSEKPRKTPKKKR